MSAMVLFDRGEEQSRLRQEPRVTFEVRSAFEDLVEERKAGRDWVVPVLLSRVLLAAQACETAGFRSLSTAICDWVDALDEPSWVEASLRERVERELLGRV